jgi:hypothetical protein
MVPPEKTSGAEPDTTPRLPHAQSQRAGIGASQWDANQVLVEEAGTALGLLDELRGSVMGLTGIKPERDKVTRRSIASAQFEAGHFSSFALS